ncbi:hypothetical protein J437_LFUL013130, partial [Ladona fulva]
IRKNGVRKTYTEKYHCCHGFERAPNQPGCVKGNEDEDTEKNLSTKPDTEIIP